MSALKPWAVPITIQDYTDVIRRKGPIGPGHSLRAGLATAAAKAGKSERSIMKQTGHRSVSVVRRYIRDAELFDDNAAAGIGL